jgi:hypothetical protein
MTAADVCPRPGIGAAQEPATVHNPPTRAQSNPTLTGPGPGPGPPLTAWRLDRAATGAAPSKT